MSEWVGSLIDQALREIDGPPDSTSSETTELKPEPISEPKGFIDYDPTREPGYTFIKIDYPKPKAKQLSRSLVEKRESMQSARLRR